MASAEISTEGGEVGLSARGVVEALYEVLLLRKSDEDGMRKKLAGLASGETTMRQIIHEMVASEEFARKLTPFLESTSDAASRKFMNDVSEGSEVWQLIRLWVNAQASSGYVIDVGARGRERSNSYDLLKHFGWRGLLIEANPALLPSIERDFHGLDVRLLSCAISDYSGRASFTLGVNDDVSSLTSSLSKGWGSVRGEVDVEVRRLAEVLRDHDVPWEFDLLSLDIEGEDHKVLNDLVTTSPYRPNWIVIEAGPSDQAVRHMHDPRFSREVRRCYEARAATPSNLILGRRNAAREDWLARCASDR